MGLGPKGWCRPGFPGSPQWLGNQSCLPHESSPALGGCAALPVLVSSWQLLLGVQLGYLMGVMCLQCLDFLSLNPPPAILVFTGRDSVLNHEPHHGVWPWLEVLRIGPPSEAPLETSGSSVKACNPQGSVSTYKTASNLHMGRRLCSSTLSRLLAPAHLCLCPQQASGSSGDLGPASLVGWAASSEVGARLGSALFRHRKYLSFPK